MAVYITGDKHGDFVSADDYQKVRKFCADNKTTPEKDYMIVLGDHGVTFYGNDKYKKHLVKYAVTFILIHGNHDRRPKGYNLKRVYVSNNQIAGMFYREDRFPNILYPMEYGSYIFAGHPVYIMGGAYSVDKEWRKEQEAIEEMRGNNVRYWFADEQMSDDERDDAWGELQKIADYMDRGLLRKEPILFMTHTCPMGHVPFSAFLSGVDQSQVDRRTENFFDQVETLFVDHEIPYKWYCGHWHTDTVDGDVRFMYHDILEIPEADGWPVTIANQTANTSS